MPRDQSGTYTLPPGNPVIVGTIIESNWANPTMSDLGLEMTDSLSRTGKGGMLGPLLLLDGSNGTPSLGFVTEFATGRFLFGPGNMRDTVLGVDVQAYTINAVTPFVPLRVQDGALGAPSLSFANDPATGRYLINADSMRDVVAGVDVIEYRAAAINPQVQTRLPVGALTVPALAFNAEQNSGRFWAGVGDIREVVLGNNIMRFLTTGVEVFLDGEWFPIDPREAGGGGSKNILINGAFDVWQRGDGPFTTLLGYTSDRWLLTSGATTVQKFDWGVGADKPRSFGLQMSQTAIGTGVIAQRLESSDAAKTNGKILTASFVLDPVSGAALTSVSFQLRYVNAKDDWGGGGTIIDTIIVNVNGGANEVLTATFAAMPPQVNNGLELNIRCQNSVGPAASWVISEVQLETSASNSDFEHLPVATILEKCKRYYERWDFAQGDRALPFASIGMTANSGLSHVQFSVEKRAIPTIVINAITSWAVIGFGGVPSGLTTMADSDISTRSLRLDWGTASALAGGGAVIALDSGGSMTIDAEL